jgi:hypothetical protein
MNFVIDPADFSLPVENKGGIFRSFLIIVDTSKNGPAIPPVSNLRNLG